MCCLIYLGWNCIYLFSLTPIVPNNEPFVAEGFVCEHFEYCQPNNIVQGVHGDVNNLHCCVER